MFNGWTRYDDRDAERRSRPNSPVGGELDYWTNTPTHAWGAEHGQPWVLTFARGTSRLVLFPQSGSGVVWTSPPWPSQAAADGALEGHATAEGSLTWLAQRLRDASMG